MIRPVTLAVVRKLPRSLKTTTGLPSEMPRRRASAELIQTASSPLAFKWGMLSNWEFARALACGLTSWSGYFSIPDVQRALKKLPDPNGLQPTAR
jgi:hypothetical protein